VDTIAARAPGVRVPSASIRIRALEPADDSRWDEYVQSHQHGTPFHTIAWKNTIIEGFGYEPKYLVAVEGTSIRGVLPLFLVSNLLMGKVLVSSPFAVYGGVLADDPGVRDLFRDAVTELGASLGVDYVELRNVQLEQRLGFAPVSRYVTFEQSIGPEEEALLEAIPRKVRYMVRKSLKAGFETRRSEQATDAFLDLYSQSLRRLGTPCFPYKHFHALMRNFRGSVDVREVMYKGQVASAVLTFYMRDQVFPFYGASDPALNNVAPNNFMYFDLMRWAGANGYKNYDFGRSKKGGSGSYDFKAHWGMAERELPYEILLVKRKELPNINPNNKAFRWPLEIWRRLPLPVTRWIGPMFLRLVP
jgi:FemAB-related protein (PEP-CTERM system-associated)